MAAAASRGHLVEEGVAVDHEALRGQRIGDDTGLAWVVTSVQQYVEMPEVVEGHRHPVHARGLEQDLD
ncbi:hypothetical protein VDGL01_05077 [Verticillium dahliae]